MTRKWTQAIFYVNVSRANAISQIYHSVWCGKCYTLSNDVEFVVNGSAQDKANEEDQNRLEFRWGNIHQSKNDFHHERNGDHLIVPFECDECIFVKLQNFSTSSNNQEKDKLLLACIQRANLDAF
jgi:hypothetical protein